MAVVTLEEAKNYLRVDSADDDNLITALIEVAEDLVEKFTWQTLLIKSFELIYDEAGESIEIPKSPLVEVTKIEVIDDEGTKTLVDPSIYMVDLTGMRGRIYLKKGCTWPSHRGFASFIITVKAGYGSVPEEVPMALRQAALSALSILYENRGMINEQEIISAISEICWSYRIFRL